MTTRDMILCGLFALVLPSGQTLFKWGAVYNEKLAGGFIHRVIQNYPLMIAFAWYGLSALLWFYILTRVPLSTAYPFALVGTALVPLIGWLVFKEPVSWTMFAGYLLMIAGLGLIVVRPAA